MAMSKNDASICIELDLSEQIRDGDLQRLPQIGARRSEPADGGLERDGDGQSRGAVGARTCGGRNAGRPVRETSKSTAAILVAKREYELMTDEKRLERPARS